MLPLRELNIYGMLVDPGAVMLIICVVVFVVLRAVVNRFIDLNRFVWRRPLVDLAAFVILFSVGLLTLHHI